MILGATNLIYFCSSKTYFVYTNIAIVPKYNSPFGVYEINGDNAYVYNYVSPLKI